MLNTYTVAGSITKAALLLLVVTTSSFLFAGGMFVSQYVAYIPDFIVESLYNIVERMILKMENLIMQITSYLEGPDVDFVFVRELHQYLTPLIRSYELIFRVIQRVIILLEERGEVDTSRVEELGDDFRETGNSLLRLYRILEAILGIAIGDSPIGRTWYEN